MMSSEKAAKKPTCANCYHKRPTYKGKSYVALKCYLTGVKVTGAQVACGAFVGLAGWKANVKEKT